MTKLIVKSPESRTRIGSRIIEDYLEMRLLCQRLKNEKRLNEQLFPNWVKFCISGYAQRTELNRNHTTENRISLGHEFVI